MSWARIWVLSIDQAPLNVNLLPFWPKEQLFCWFYSTSPDLHQHESTTECSFHLLNKLQHWLLQHFYQAPEKSTHLDITRPKFLDKRACHCIVLDLCWSGSILVALLSLILNAGYHSKNPHYLLCAGQEQSISQEKTRIIISETF